MKTNINELGKQDIKSSGKSTEMKLSANKDSIVFQLFTSGVYKNAIGTVVREITSNSQDSHTEAGVDSPIVIRKNKEDNGFSISFIDFGVGMSPERIYETFGTYFESTKRVDNTQIGGFGIGGKTPLAYKRSTGFGEDEYDNSFQIITRYNGTEYSYLIYEGKSAPIIDELNIEPTKEHNGTEVRIPVLEADVDTFVKEMTKQLYYFENIVFEGFEYKDYRGDTVNPLPNDYKIIRGKSFLFRGDEYSGAMHICLGRVAYPIEYGILGLSEYDFQIPIAIKLEVGDVPVVVSREEISYNEAAIKLIKKKLEEAKKEIVVLLTNQYKSIQNLEQYFQVKNEFGVLTFKNGLSLDAGELVKKEDVDFSNFKYNFMKMPNDKQLFKFFFDAKTYGKKPRRSRYNDYDGEFKGGYETLKNNNALYYVQDEFNRKVVKQAYLKDQHETYHIVQKREINDYMLRDIADLFKNALDSTVDSKGDVVPFVKSLMEMQDEFFAIVQNNCESYDDLDIPQDFIDNRKRQSAITPELRKLTIPVKFINGYSKDRVKLSVLFDYNMPIFYGTQDDSSELHRAARMYDILFDSEGMVSHCDHNSHLITGRNRRYSYNHNSNEVESKSSIIFMQIASGNVKYMKHCKNAMHVSMFKTKMLYRKETNVQQYFQMREAIEKYNEISRFYRKHINLVSEDWGAKVMEVSTFIENMPKAAKDNNLQYQKDNLSRYFKLEDIDPSDEQKAVIEKIQEILELQEKNEKTLNYFRIPSDEENIDYELITLLQVALAL